MGQRRYRTRLEILQDFLGAVRESGKKTRIIGLANLNPRSFQPYLEFCLALELVQDTPTGYRLTPRADDLLEATQRLLARSADVDAALTDLHRELHCSKTPGPLEKGALRYVSILAWNEVVRSAAESQELDAGRPRGRRSFNLVNPTTSAWLDPLGESEPDGAATVKPMTPEVDPSPRRRPSSTRSRE